MALEAATLSFASMDRRLAVLMPVKAESGSAAFLFVFECLLSYAVDEG
jgi:hypothetical protein